MLCKDRAESVMFKMELYHCSFHFNFVAAFAGGPGSEKAALCEQALQTMPGWVHLSVGKTLRTMATTNEGIKAAIVSGLMVPKDVVMQIIEQQVLLNRDADGIIIEGFPKDMDQVEAFENKVMYF